MTSTERSPARTVVEAAPRDWRERGRGVRILRSVSIFRGIPWTHVAPLADALEHRTLDPGDVLYEQGAPSTHLYIVESGTLERRVDGGEPSVLRPGDLAAIAALWRGALRATVRATSPVTLWEVDVDSLESLRLALPSFAAAVTLLAGAPGDELPSPDERSGVRIDVVGLTRRVASGKPILHDVTFSVRPGEVVALVGGSGAGKTTLLEAVAGVRPPHAGRVSFGGVDLYANLGAFRAHLGYVPQDDIIHRELPLRVTLRYAARLRLDPKLGDAVVDRIVDETLAALDLSDRAGVKVGALSGGQRKRASIAVELLARPRVFFLDEPTSGLDPSTAAELMRVLRRLADSGSTIVLSTHNPADVGHCDRVVFLARHGHLAFAGTPHAACGHFQADSIEEIYERLDAEATPREWADRFRGVAPGAGGGGAPSEVFEQPEPVPAPGPLRQWAVLTRRSLDTLARNRLTLAILAGSPVMVVLMFALLFRRGAFDVGDPNPSATVMILFWIAFGGFFFGLTYGLLQIVTEFPIVRRERLVNLRLGSYVMAKVAVLLPLLAFVDAAMLGILRVFGRLPDASFGVYASLFVSLLLGAAAALALGLFTSAAVANPEQATIALPMLCFPQVLFSGAILAVPVMASLGRWISYGMSTRWSFEALGKALEVDALWTEGRSPLGRPLLAQYEGTFSGTVVTHWALLAAMTIVFLVACWWTLARRCRRATR